MISKPIHYTEYQNSNHIPWLGRVPKYWDIAPNRAIFFEIKKQGYVDELLLSVTITKGIILQSSLLANSSKKDLSNLDKSKYKLVCENDFAYNKMRAWQGAIGLSKYRGIVSPAYVVFRLHNIQQNHKYFHYLFRTSNFAKEAERWSYGITPDMWSLRPEHFKLIYSCIPPIEEQSQIVRFLDWKTSQINKFIRNKQKLIQLLKEQKQNIINQAVTRGIDPNVKLKPSGIEWLGDIPEHWEVTKIKRTASFNPSKSETDLNSLNNGKVVFLPMENISVSGEINCKEQRQLSEVWNGFTYFKRGDVVIAKITPCFENGKGAFLDKLETDFGFGTTELLVMRPSKIIDGAFLRFITSTKTFLLLNEYYMTGAAGQKRISTDFVKGYPIAIPSIAEQKEILKYIDKKTMEFNHAIIYATRQISLMREYRDRLISDVVTGKIDVRGIFVPDAHNEDMLESDNYVLDINEEGISEADDIKVADDEDVES